MEPLITALAKVLEGLGITGILIGLLAVACWYFLTQWQASQEARIVEGKEAVKAINSMQDALERLTDVLKAKV